MAGRGAEVEPGEDVADEVVRVLVVAGIFVIGFHDALAQRGGQHDAHVGVIGGGGEGDGLEVVVAGCEDARGEGQGFGGDVAAEVDVGVVGGVFGEDVGGGEFEDLEFHGVVGLAVVAVEVEANFARVALDDALPGLSVDVADHLAEWGVLVVFEDVELGGEVGGDVGAGLGVGDGAEVAVGAVGYDGVHGEGAAGKLEDLGGVGDAVGGGVDAERGCVVVAGRKGQEGGEKEQGVWGVAHRVCQSSVFTGWPTVHTWSKKSV